MVDLDIIQATGAVRPTPGIVAELMQWLVQLKPQRETLDFIAHRVSEELRFKSCAILLPDENADQMRIEGAFQLDHHYVQEVNMRRKVRLRPGLTGGGPTTRAYGTGQVVVMEDLLTDPSFAAWRTLAKKYGFRSMISAPLLLRGKPIGVLNGYSEVMRSYRVEEQQVMLAVAAQAALAIEISGLLHHQKCTIKELRRVTESLQSQQAVLERLQEIHQQLTDLVLRGEGVVSLTATLARLLNRPVLAWDRFRHPLTSSSPPAQPQPDDLLPQWQTWLNDPAVAGSLSRLNPDKASLQLRPNQAAGRASPLTVAPVMVDGEVLGYLGAVELNGPIDHVEQRALEQGATVLALEMVKHSAVRETEERLKADFFHDLFEGRFTEGDRLRQRAVIYQIDLSVVHQVALLALHDFPGYAAARGFSEPEANRVRLRLMQTIGDSLARAIPGLTVTLMGQRLTCVYPLPRGDASSRSGMVAFRAVLNEVKHSDPGLTALVVLAGSCRAPQDFQTAYRDALKALQVLKNCGQRERIISVDDLGLYRLLLSDSAPSRILEAAHSLLGDLLTRDQRRTSELFRTLAAFLDCECDLQVTADKLGVHANTLKYRLRQIEEITGLSPRRPHDLLQLNFAVTVTRLLGPDSHAICP